MPTLIVLRHAKAEHTLGRADPDRSLTGRGRRDARAAGDWLRADGLRPDQVLCSTAQRTRETLEGLGLDAPVSYEPGIYDNDVDTLLDLIRQTGDDVRTLLLVGHNPSFHQLVLDLSGTAPDTFPTCALAVIELDDGWAETWPGAGRTTALWTPVRA
ncbi:MAG: putative phosphohistidine phosphatase, SixA [Streptosporangiaceae bacterium]|jgi:phosphohistidine phosphatase|nr:putative phosphohistidine phosphatase, SixA [Streptosporangiaceae bacterium]